MSNQDVVRLVQAGADEEFVLHRICESEPEFNLSQDSTVQLVKTGVSEPVIGAMEARQRGRAFPGCDPSSAPKVRRASRNRAKNIAIAALVIGGIVVAGYYGHKAGIGGGGRCNLPTDRAADGSLCGGRASSERPGGRP
jgi:hypothetical protein